MEKNVNDTRIPKIIHYCWFGDNPMPASTRKCIETWKKYCPDYEIKEWNENSFDVKKYQYTKEAYAEKKWAFVSDVCRLEKIYEYGGIYLDVNTDVLRSFDQLLSDGMFIGFEQDNMVAPSVFGARERHPFIKEMIDLYKKERLLDNDGLIKYKTINSRFQPELVKLGMKPDNTLQKVEDIRIYPKEYFQPLYWDSPKKDPITENTYTIHHFGGSWLSDKEMKKQEWLMSQPLISIVIPVYNVEKYLNDCINSILNQDYKNLEIVLVDDKSTDNSGVIADKYARENEAIHVIHKPKNGGLAAARNTGIEISTGDIVLFVDSDDILRRSACELVARKFVANKCEVVYYEFDLFNSLPNFTNTVERPNSQLVEKNCFSLRSLKGDDRFNIFPASACKLAIGRKLLNRVNFDEDIKRCEDYPFFYKTLLLAKRICYIDEYLYFYRQDRGDSITSDSQNIEYFIVALTKIHDFLINHKMWNEFQIDYIRLVAHYLYYYTVYYDVNEEYVRLARKLLINVNIEEYFSKKGIINKEARECFTALLTGSLEGLHKMLPETRPDYINMTGKQRILCPTAFGSFGGGGERSTYALWRWLNKHFDIIIALPKDTKNEYLYACKKDGVSYILCDYQHANPDQETAIVNLLESVKKYHPDIIFPGLYFAPAFQVAAITNIPCVFLGYSILHIAQITQPIKENIKHYGDLLSKSNSVIVNSLMEVDAAKQFGRHATLAHSYTATPKAKLKKTSKTHLIYPARIDGQKMQHKLVEAADIIHNRHIETEVKIIGSYEPNLPGAKEYYDFVKKSIKDKNLDKVVKFLGWKDNPWNEFGVNDIYVTTTASEAVGRATLEAVELGIPILIPDIPGHREFKEVIGISKEHFYDPGNMQDFADKAEYLIKHIEDAKIRAEKYCIKATSAFNEENCNKNVLPVLKGIIGQGNPAFYDYGQEQTQRVFYLERLIRDKDTELAVKTEEINSFLSIKRSTKLTVGNIKRRLGRDVASISDRISRNSKDR